VLRKRRIIPWAFLLLMVAGQPRVFGRLKVDNFLLEDWPEDDPQKQEYYWFEEHFGGVRPFEMEVTLTSDSTALVWDLDVLRSMEAVQGHLTQQYGVQAVLSPVTIVKTLNKAFNGGSDEFYALPDDEDECRRMAKRADAASVARTCMAPW
jgi:uncharacterized protein